MIKNIAISCNPNINKTLEDIIRKIPERNQKISKFESGQNVEVADIMTFLQFGIYKSHYSGQDINEAILMALSSGLGSKLEEDAINLLLTRILKEDKQIEEFKSFCRNKFNISDNQEAIVTNMNGETLIALSNIINSPPVNISHPKSLISLCCGGR